MDHNFLFYNQEDGCCLTGKGLCEVTAGGVCFFLRCREKFYILERKDSFRRKNRD